MSAPLHDLTTSTPPGPERPGARAMSGQHVADAILVTVVKLLAEVIDEGDDLDLEITRETSFSDDIEMESIEFVALGEMLVEVYGYRVDLIAWFGDLDVDQIIGLTVGHLVDFIAVSLAG